jgi:hypothetical protein
MATGNKSELMGRLLDNKEMSRHELARLPIETKLRMIVLMQRRANEIRQASGRPTKPEWPLSEFRFNQGSFAASTANPFVQAVDAAFMAFEGTSLTATPESEASRQRIEAQFSDLEARGAGANPGAMEILRLLGGYVEAARQAEQYINQTAPAPVFTATTGTSFEPV